MPPGANPRPAGKDRWLAVFDNWWTSLIYWWNCAALVASYRSLFRFRTAHSTASRATRAVNSHLLSHSGSGWLRISTVSVLSGTAAATSPTWSIVKYLPPESSARSLSSGSFNQTWLVSTLGSSTWNG